MSLPYFPLPRSAVRVLFPGTACREDAVGCALFSVAETMSTIRFTALYSIPFFASAGYRLLPAQPVSEWGALLQPGHGLLLRLPGGLRGQKLLPPQRPLSHHHM